MRLLIAPNPFKGTLTALEAAAAMARGAKSVLPGARTALLPVADGGDGLIEALTHALGGRLRGVRVTGPLGERRLAHYALLPDGSAVVEMARASGLGLHARRRDPMGATSAGTGELIAAAVAAGAKTILVGLGGSASSDGGAGMAQALGARLLDEDGRELGPGAAALARLARVDARPLKARMKGIRVLGVSDVTNPLLGPRGSAAVFGPQKGAGPSQVRALEKALTRYAAVLKRDLGVSVAARAGAGAAGGLGAGLLAFLGARIVPGAELVLRRVGLGRALASADAVLTGEGRLDRTSFLGKAPVELARRAGRAGLPVAAVCGALEPGLGGRLARAGIRATATLAEAGASSESARRRAAFWTEKAAALAVTRLLLAAAALWLAACPAPAAAPAERDLGAVDSLYWHRDQPGNLDRHLERLDALLKAGPDDPALLWRRCRALVRRGEGRSRKAEKLENFSAARADCERSIKLEPNLAESRFWHGIALGRWGQTKGIMRSLFLVKPMRREMEKVLELDPKHGGAHHVLGEMLTQIPGFAGGDKDRALKEFEEAVRLSPGYSVSYVSLADAYLAKGRRADAVAVLEKVLALKEPADPAGYPNDARDARERLEKLR